MRTSRALLVPLVHVPSFLVLSLAWGVLLGIGVAVWIVATGGVAPTAALDLLDATTTGLLTIVQIGGFALAALALALLVPTEVPPYFSLPRDRAGVVLRLRIATAAWRAPWPYLVAGLLGGAVVWTLPSWMAERLMEFFPGWPTVLEQINELLLGADALGRVALVLAITVSAPLFEELIFRGYLWRVLEIGLGRHGAFFGTTVLFAMYHLDPLHVVSLIPTALFLGWLRLRSASLLPSILAHFANNAIAVAFTLLLPIDPSTELGLPLALGGMGLTLALAAVADAVVRRRDRA